jgi:hypothetical protein
MMIVEEHLAPQTPRNESITMFFILEGVAGVVYILSTLSYALQFYILINQIIWFYDAYADVNGER